MGINRRYFDTLLAEHSLSLRGLAKRMDMNHSQLSLTLSGARRLQLDEAAKMAEVFDQPLTTIAANMGIGADLARARINVIGALNGDGEVVPIPGDIRERVAVPASIPQQSVAIQARTEGTALSWLDGTVSVCRDLPAADGEVLGRICWVKLADGREVYSMVRRGYLAGTYNLSGPYTEESARIAWAKPVILTIH